jgi:hypothetical protein
MEYLKNIQSKDPNLLKDSPISKMYTCTRDTKNVSAVSNLIGLVVIITILGYMIYLYINKPPVSITGLSFFATEQDIVKIFASMLILVNIKTLSNSMIENIILPVVGPLLPLITCNLKLKIGLFEMFIGEFISDLLVFSVNIFVIYFLFNILY